MVRSGRPSQARSAKEETRNPTCKRTCGHGAHASEQRRSASNCGPCENGNCAPDEIRSATAIAELARVGPVRTASSSVSSSGCRVCTSYHVEHVTGAGWPNYKPAPFFLPHQRVAVASLRSVLSMAVEDDLIPKNPAFAKSLGRGVVAKEPERKARAMEPEGAARFLAAASEGEYLALSLSPCVLD